MMREVENKCVGVHKKRIERKKEVKKDRNDLNNSAMVEWKQLIKSHRFDLDGITDLDSHE